MRKVPRAVRTSTAERVSQKRKRSVSRAPSGVKRPALSRTETKGVKDRKEPLKKAVQGVAAGKFGVEETFRVLPALRRPQGRVRALVIGQGVQAKRQEGGHIRPAV